MNEIVKQGSGLIGTFDEAARAAKAMAQSGYFTDAREVAQAMVKIMAGHEMGFGPFAAMNGIHIIKGKPAVGANLMAAAVKSHPLYDYRVVHIDDDVVEIAFYQGGEQIGVSSFSKQDAEEAGLMGRDNWRKFTRNMLFARAMSNGVRWYCPDVFAGSTVYTPEELGGDIVEGEVRDVDEPDPALSSGPGLSPDPNPPFLNTDVEEIPHGDTVFEDDERIEEMLRQDVGEVNHPPHWIDDPQTRKRFWAWADEQGLNGDDVHKALGVESVRDYGGDKKSAVVAIETWITEQLEH